MKNVGLFLLFIFIYSLGYLFTLILLYASPDNIPHSIEGSIFSLGSTILMFSLLYNMQKPLNVLMKYGLAILGIYFCVCYTILALIVVYAHPISNTTDFQAAFIFVMCSFIVSSGVFFLFVGNKQKVLENA